MVIAKSFIPFKWLHCFNNLINNRRFIKFIISTVNIIKFMCITKSFRLFIDNRKYLIS